jgi:hypothetical protein
VSGVTIRPLDRLGCSVVMADVAHELARKIAHGGEDAATDREDGEVFSVVLSAGSSWVKSRASTRAYSGFRLRHDAVGPASRGC